MCGVNKHISYYRFRNARLCGVNKHISYYRFRNARFRSVDCVFIFIDTDMATLEINSRSMFISIILIYLSCSFLLMDWCKDLRSWFPNHFMDWCKEKGLNFIGGCSCG